MPNSRTRAWVGYARASLLRLRGAKLGRKCRVDRLHYVERPKGLNAGNRTHFEQNVAIKMVSPEAVISLGDRVFLGRNTTLDISNKLAIGDRTLVAPGCLITDHNHGIRAGVRIVDQVDEARPVVIGADAWIGANSCVLPGVRIGNGTVVGAGAVVSRDLPDNCVAVGVPARIIGFRA